MKTKQATEQYKIFTSFSFKEDSEDGAEKLTIEGYANFSGDVAAGDIYVDCSRDVIIPSGMELTQFKKNPQILWQHDRRCTVGKALSITKKKDGIFIKAEIHKDAMDEKDYYKVKAGLISYFSVGFRCLKTEWKEVDGKEICFITKSELFEVSLVGIPANGESRFEVKAYGTDGIFAGDLFTDHEANSNTTEVEGEEKMKVKLYELLPADKVKEFEELGLQSQLAEEQEISFVKYLDLMLTKADTGMGMKMRGAMEAVVKDCMSKMMSEMETMTKAEDDPSGMAEMAKRMHKVVGQVTEEKMQSVMDDMAARSEKKDLEEELADKLGITVDEIKAMTQEEIEEKIKNISDDTSEEDEVKLKSVFDEFTKSIEKLTSEEA
jgi:HK97 family phage prohead protease